MKAKLQYHTPHILPPVQDVSVAAIQKIASQILKFSRYFRRDHFIVNFAVN